MKAFSEIATFCMESTLKRKIVSKEDLTQCPLPYTQTIEKRKKELKNENSGHVTTSKFSQRANNIASQPSCNPQNFSSVICFPQPLNNPLPSKTKMKEPKRSF